MAFTSKEDWLQWLELGGKPGPYFPRDPEGYYTKECTWRGWDHFLGKAQQLGKDPFEIHVTSDHSDMD